MDICLCIQKIVGISGGAEKVLVDVANHLAETGHDVSIVCFEDTGGAPFYRLNPKIDFHNMKPFNDRRSDRAWRNAVREQGSLERLIDRAGQVAGRIPLLARLVWNKQNNVFVKRLAQFIDWRKPDLMISFMPGITPQVIKARRKATFKPRVIFSCHNLPNADFNDLTKWSTNRHDIALRRRAVSDSDATTVLLPEYREWFRASEQKNIEVLPNFIPDAQRHRVQYRKPILISVGRLTATKNHEMLIRAFHLLKDELPDWQIRIFGKGPLEQHLTDLIQELGLAGQVQLMGHTSDIAAEYLSAACMVLPSVHEGFPLVVGEAFAHGLPVVGFADCSGVNYLVRDKKNGILIEERSIAALSETIRTVAKDNTMRRRLSKGAFAFVDNGEYSHQTVMAKWDDLIARVMR
ncbi:glycosyltransferase [Falsirhodobacter sp. alg1]|uniref:glycosyltransferase n=1 Tax=Falsirhodobacter sp. alg1 TaxID=1472418 RepID=UPI0007876588|nr:glycosyltransferase [Falsirhodobacter sp. alg1]